MFQIMPKLRPNEEITVIRNGTETYIVKRTDRDRNTEFREALSKCPKLFLTGDEMISFKNEGRK
jgi:hypothetical protein